MSKKIPYDMPSGNVENASERFLSVQFTILKTTLTLEEKVAYALIVSWRDAECFYSHASFAELLSCSRRKAQDVLASLAKKGLIEVVSRPGASNVYKAVPWQTVLPPTQDTLADSATPPSKSCYTPWQTVLPPLADSATYNNNYKITDKIIDKNSSVADAPPSLDSILEQPIKTPEPTRFVASDLPSEDRAKLLALLKGPASLWGFDPEKRLQEILQRAEAWSCSGTDKKKFRVSWFETLKRQFVGREIKALASKQKTPASQTGLSKQEIETLWDLGWRHYHPEDWPADQETPAWVTDWHREVYRVACSEAFGMNYQSFFREEPAKNSNFHVTKFRRVLETIKLPETR